MAEAALRPSPADDSLERLPTEFDLCYTWNYDTVRQELGNLYEKAKRDQWNATDQLPWSLDVDPEAENIPDIQIPVYATHIWDKLTPGEVKKLRREPLLPELTHYVMKDEARHVAFGVLSLADFFTQLSPSERRDREEFLTEGCRLMRDRLLMEDVWEEMGWPVDEVRQIVLESPQMKEFRKMLFAKVVPNVKRLGLLTPFVRERFAELDILQFENEEPSA